MVHLGKDISLPSAVIPGKPVAGATGIQPPLCLPPSKRLCCDTTDHLDVMLSESEASAFQTVNEKADSSAVPQNDILPQSPKGESSAGRLPFRENDSKDALSF